MKTAIISGSVREGRESHKAALYLAQKLNDQGIETDLVDLPEEALPIFGDPYIESQKVDQKAEALGKRLQEADAMILVSPEYHGSLSGVLKNALDYFWAEFQDKPIGVTAVSAGKMGGINASVQIQHIILSLGAYPMPLKWQVSDVENVFDKSGRIQDVPTERAAKKFIKSFLWFSEALINHKDFEQNTLAGTGGFG